MSPYMKDSAVRILTVKMKLLDDSRSQYKCCGAQPTCYMWFAIFQTFFVTLGLSHFPFSIYITLIRYTTWPGVFKYDHS